MGILSSMPLPAEGLAAVGLEIRADDEDMAFDEEDWWQSFSMVVIFIFLINDLLISSAT